MAIVTPGDIAPFADIEATKLAQMIADAEAMAVLAAPCIAEEDFLLDEARVSQVKAVLRSAILRWEEAGTGAAVQRTAGPFSQTLDTRQARRSMFWPSELTQLRDICSQYRNTGKQVAFAVDTAPPPRPNLGLHALDCALVFKGNYCTCGSDLNNGEGPLWGGVVST